MAKADIKEITEKLEKGVKDIFTSEKYVEYLRFMSKFTKYSFNNCMLIMMQMPNASLVAGYGAWKSKFNRQVRKGEKAIKIIAPCPHKKEVEDKEGNAKEVCWISFTTANVFDISQTDGDDIPKGCVTKLAGEVKGYDALVASLHDIAPVPVEIDDISSGANGYFSSAEGKIVLQKGMSQQQTVKTLVHEISHAMLHGKDGEEKEADRKTREVQAESVAYTVCSALGLDTSDYSFGYIAGWSSGKELKELSASMEVIRKTAKGLIEALAA